MRQFREGIVFAKRLKVVLVLTVKAQNDEWQNRSRLTMSYSRRPVYAPDASQVFWLVVFLVWLVGRRRRRSIGRYLLCHLLFGLRSRHALGIAEMLVIN